MSRVSPKGSEGACSAWRGAESAGRSVDEVERVILLPVRTTRGKKRTLREDKP